MEKDNTYENSNIEGTETSRLEAENIMETSAGELVASQKAQNPGVLYIQMLGGFSMTYQGQPILLGKSLSSKMLHLLMLLIYSRGEGIRRADPCRLLRVHPVFPGLDLVPHSGIHHIFHHVPHQFSTQAYFSVFQTSLLLFKPCPIF